METVNAEKNKWQHIFILQRVFSYSTRTIQNFVQLGTVNQRFRETIEDYSAPILHILFTSNLKKLAEAKKKDMDISLIQASLPLIWRNLPLVFATICQKLRSSNNNNNNNNTGEHHSSLFFVAREIIRASVLLPSTETQQQVLASVKPIQDNSKKNKDNNNDDDGEKEVEAPPIEQSLFHDLLFTRGAFGSMNGLEACVANDHIELIEYIFSFDDNFINEKIRALAASQQPVSGDKSIHPPLLFIAVINNAHQVMRFLVKQQKFDVWGIYQPKLTATVLSECTGASLLQFALLFSAASPASKNAAKPASPSSNNNTTVPYVTTQTFRILFYEFGIGAAGNEDFLNRTFRGVVREAYCAPTGIALEDITVSYAFRIECEFSFLSLAIILKRGDLFPLIASSCCDVRKLFVGISQQLPGLFFGRSFDSAFSAAASLFAHNDNAAMTLAKTYLALKQFLESFPTLFAPLEYRFGWSEDAGFDPVGFRSNGYNSAKNYTTACRDVHEACLLRDKPPPGRSFAQFQVTARRKFLDKLDRREAFTGSALQVAFLQKCLVLLVEYGLFPNPLVALGVIAAEEFPKYLNDAKLAAEFLLDENNVLTQESRIREFLRIGKLLFDQIQYISTVPFPNPNRGEVVTVVSPSHEGCEEFLQFCRDRHHDMALRDLIKGINSPGKAKLACNVCGGFYSTLWKM